MSSQTGRLIYSWNSSNWELLATMPESTDYCPQHHEVPTRSFADETSTAASVTLLTSYLLYGPTLKLPWFLGHLRRTGSLSERSEYRISQVDLVCKDSMWTSSHTCFKFGLKQELHITEWEGWSKKRTELQNMFLCSSWRSATLTLRKRSCMSHKHPPHCHSPSPVLHLHSHFQPQTHI